MTAVIWLAQAMYGNCGLVSTGRVETSLHAAGDVSPFAAGAKALSALSGILRPLCTGSFKTLGFEDSAPARTGRAVHSAMRHIRKGSFDEEFDRTGFDLASSVREFDLARNRNLTSVQDFDQ